MLPAASFSSLLSRWDLRQTWTDQASKVIFTAGQERNTPHVHMCKTLIIPVFLHKDKMKKQRERSVISPNCYSAKFAVVWASGDLPTRRSPVQWWLHWHRTEGASLPNAMSFVQGSSCIPEPQDSSPQPPGACWPTAHLLLWLGFPTTPAELVHGLHPWSHGRTKVTWEVTRERGQMKAKGEPQQPAWPRGQPGSSPKAQPSSLFTKLLLLTEFSLI